MSAYGVEPYDRAHAHIDLRMDAAAANRILLAIEHLDQASGVDPALDDLRRLLKAALVKKSSGDVDSEPSTE